MLYFSLSFLGLICSFQVVPPPSPTIRGQADYRISNDKKTPPVQSDPVSFFVKVQAKITLPYDYTIP
jgi:hypothetical protein